MARSRRIWRDVSIFGSSASRSCLRTAGRIHRAHAADSRMCFRPSWVRDVMTNAVPGWSPRMPPVCAAMRRPLTARLSSTLPKSAAWYSTGALAPGTASLKRFQSASCNSVRALTGFSGCPFEVADRATNVLGANLGREVKAAPDQSLKEQTV